MTGGGASGPWARSSIGGPIDGSLEISAPNAVAEPAARRCDAHQDRGFGRPPRCRPPARPRRSSAASSRSQDPKSDRWVVVSADRHGDQRAVEHLHVFDAEAATADNPCVQRQVGGLPVNESSGKEACSTLTFTKKSLGSLHFHLRRQSNKRMSSAQSIL